MSNKETNGAVKAIRDYLDRRAAEDAQFAAVYANPKKNIDECFRYILHEAKKRGTAVCMTDDEVFGLAVHYYDEADLVVPAKMPGASVSRPAAPKVELTEQEKEEARRAARLKYEQQCMLELEREEAERRKKEAERKKERQAAKEAASYSPSLFDFD